jgi:hypothetical protein
MGGHKFVKVKEDFFKDGWVSENLSLSEEKQKFMLKTQNPYFIAKLASTEIFGRIYALGESLENVKSHILRKTEIISRSLIGASAVNLMEILPHVFYF